MSVTLSIDSFYQMSYLSKFQLHTIYWEGGTSVGGWCASPLLFTTHYQHRSFTQKSLKSSITKWKHFYLAVRIQTNYINAPENVVP